MSSLNVGTSWKMLDPRITGSEDEAWQITLAVVLVLFSLVFYGSIIVFYGFNMGLYGFVWFCIVFCGFV